MEVIEKALKIASTAHEKQYRKQSKIPYITHPVAVGMILLKAGYREEVIAAGILHDTVEDTAVTLEDIKKEFGAKIAEMVEGCSEPDKSLSWEERKEHSIHFLKTAPEEVRIVACADKLHNVKSIIYDYEKIGETVWARFKRGKNQQEWYYRNIVESLGAISTFELLDQLKVTVDKLFTMKPADY